MPTVNFPSSPTVGQTYSFGDKTWQWNGYAWDFFSFGSSGGVRYLTDLEDVTITDPYAGDGLVYNGVEWVNDGIVNTINGNTGDIVALSNFPTPISGVQFDANYGDINNLDSINPNNGASTSLTINGDLIVNGSIYALNPYQTIEGNTIDTIPDNLDGGLYE